MRDDEALSGRLARDDLGLAHAAPLLGSLPSAVIGLDPAARIVALNPAAEQLLSVSWNSARGRPLADLLAPHGRLVDLAREVQSQGHTISDFAFELALARGEVIQVDCHLTPVAELPGHVVILLHPRSAARSLDIRLGQRGATRSVAALAALLAHEVKNPLSGIRGAAQLLEPAIGEEDRPLIRLICDETDRIVSLVDRMEEFAQPGNLRRGPVNIHQVLEHVRRLAESGFARHVRIVELYDPSLPPVDGDRDRLVQVFLNLIKNAAEAIGGEGGQITLVTQYQHGLRMRVANSEEPIELPITVEVRDNGPGVPADLVEALFEPFVTTKAKGGLGLALVAKLVADHGGIVSHLATEAGTVFRVRLPAAARASRRDAAEACG